jgi:hypothetical protein
MCITSKYIYKFHKNGKYVLKEICKSYCNGMVKIVPSTYWMKMLLWYSFKNMRSYWSEGNYNLTDPCS